MVRAKGGKKVAAEPCEPNRFLDTLLSNNRVASRIVVDRLVQPALDSGEPILDEAVSGVPGTQVQTGHPR